MFTKQEAEEKYREIYKRAFIVEITLLLCVYFFPIVKVAMIVSALVFLKLHINVTDNTPEYELENLFKSVPRVELADGMVYITLEQHFDFFSKYFGIPRNTFEIQTTLTEENLTSVQELKNTCRENILSALNEWRRNPHYSSFVLSNPNVLDKYFKQLLELCISCNK
jgi:hypothetical protein